MKENIRPKEDIILSDYASEIKGVIIGKCRICGEERVVSADQQGIAEVIHKLSVLRTQKCGSRNSNETWTLLEGYVWDFSHLADQ